MRAITEERAGTDMVFRVSVPANKADAVRRHLESMMMLLGESVVTIGAPEETPDLPPGPMLKKLRKERGLSQKSLAEQLGTNQVRVSDMEQGVRPITPEFATKLGRLRRFGEVLPGVGVRKKRKRRNGKAPQAGAWRGFFGAISAAEALLSGLAEFAGDARLHKADELAARRRRAGHGAGPCRR